MSRPDAPAQLRGDAWTGRERGGSGGGDMGVLTVLRRRGRRRQPALAPRVPPGTVVYAVGDVHGCARCLRALRAQIRRDAAPTGATRKLVVYLGDYIDRGPDVRGVIDALVQEPLDGFEEIALAGNHETWFADVLANPAEAGPAWLDNGGLATLYSYGVPAPPWHTAEPDDWIGLRDRLVAAMPEAHRTFLTARPLSHREGDYLFVHAGVRPGVPMDSQSATDLLWIREAFAQRPHGLGVVVVHGHTPVDTPVVQADRIAVDTGAYATGTLTAVRLLAAQAVFLQEANHGDGDRDETG